MEEQQKSPIGRRAVAKGIAWSVPAFALATAAPALAASPLITIVEGDACKYPGGSEGEDLKHAYMFPVTVTNLSNEEVCLKVTAAYADIDGKGRLNGVGSIWTGPPTNSGSTQIAEWACLAIGASVTYYVVVAKTGNSAQSAGTANVELLVKGSTTGRQYVDVASTRFNTTPPDCPTGTSATKAEKSSAAESTVTSEESADSANVEEKSGEDTSAESSESTSAEEPAASDGGGEQPAASDGGR